MSKGRTVAFNLYDSHLEVLNRLARRHGSRSAALQRLLEEAEVKNIYQELEEAYEEYFSLAGNREADRKLAEELLAVASWPEEWREGGSRARKRGRGKQRKAR
jgi:hypothetical protein